MVAFGCCGNSGSLEDLKEILISCSFRIDCTKNQAQDLIIGVSQMKKKD